jgi:hypothetical protein
MAWRCRFLTARRSQHCHVIAENDLVKNYRAPDTLVDFHTGAPPGEANYVVVRHTASDSSKGLHLRAIATMAPARPRYGGRWLPRLAFPEVDTMANVEVDYWLDHERATGFD